MYTILCLLAELFVKKKFSVIKININVEILESKNSVLIVLCLLNNICKIKF